MVLSGAAAALVLGGAALVLDAQGREPGQDLTETSTSNSWKAESTEALRTPRADQHSRPPESGGASEAPARGYGEPSLPDGSVGRPLEVLPPVDATPTGLPMPSAPAALIDTPLPATASALGKIVKGFPTRILSFPDGTVVVFTGVSSNGDIFQATAEGIVDLSAEKVVGHFQQALRSMGFSSGEPAATAGEQTLRLTRATDSVTIAFSATGTGSTRFSLLGSFHAGTGGD